LERWGTFGGGVLPKAGVLTLTDQLSAKKGTQTVNWQ
jgi:hypothetical protein